MLKWNGLADANHLAVGQELQIQAKAPETKPTGKETSEKIEPASDKEPLIVANGRFDFWSKDGKLNYWTHKDNVATRSADAEKSESALLLKAAPGDARAGAGTRLELPADSVGRTLRILLAAKAPKNTVTVLVISPKNNKQLARFKCQTNENAYTRQRFDVVLPKNMEEKIWLHILVDKSAQDGALIDSVFAFFPEK